MWDDIIGSDVALQVRLPLPCSWPDVPAEAVDVGYDRVEVKQAIRMKISAKTKPYANGPR